VTSVGPLTAAALESARLVLEPLAPGHADELAPVLDDRSLHRFIGGEPAGLAELRGRFERQAVGHSPDGRESWLNWVVRCRSTGQAVGTVQATVSATGSSGAMAQLAWVIGTAYQRRGLAREAVAVMSGWLREHGVSLLRANIHPDHAASIAVARAVGLAPTDVVVDGEVRWECAV
jgi:RimJ/RimL family protein N-acetyltransferase